ncbi:MAG: TraR/DksA C4-type zinc finger protein [bacterium]|nr:TraR/DksA C4-type zinc finger protein [bacterium]
MVELLPGKQGLCKVCGGEIPEARIAALPGVRTCVLCQKKLEERRRIEDSLEAEADRLALAPLQHPRMVMDGANVVVGSWSGNLMDVVARGSELRALVLRGDRSRARALVQALPVEEQAALVALDEDPEQMLSLAGMGDENRPAYSTPVMDLLPSELLSSLISIDPEEEKFNTELIRAMSPGTLGRLMAEILEPIDNVKLRAQVSWEWLRALAELNDADRLAELLTGVDPALLEEAVLDHLENLELQSTALEIEMEEGEFEVEQFRLFSQEASVGVRLGETIKDPETRRVINALFEAAPELMRYIVRAAWELSGGGGQEDDSGVKKERKPDES